MSKWQSTILVLCSAVHWSQQITSQQLYSQMVNKPQLYGQYLGKQPILGQYSSPQQMLVHYTNPQPALFQYKQQPLIGQFSNIQPAIVPFNSQLAFSPQFHNQIKAQFSSPKPIFTQPVTGKKVLFQSPFAGQMAKQQMIQQQMAANRLRARWPGPYKSIYPATNTQTPLFRPQTQFTSIPNSYGQAYAYKAAQKNRPYGTKPSDPQTASAYVYHSGISPNSLTGHQQPSKTLGEQPFKFISSLPQKTIVPAVIPTKSYVTSVSQNSTSGSNPSIQALSPSSVSSNFFEPYKQTYVGDASQIAYGGAITHNNNVMLTLAKPVRTIVYPVKADSERGPIHTIPAPNLSLKDKPIVVAEGSNYEALQSPYLQYPQFNQAPAYEVKEETKDQVYRNPISGESKLFAPDPQTKLSSSNYFSTPLKPTYSQDTAFKAHSVTPSLTSQELFQLLNRAPSQQQLADTYNFPLLQQPQLQQHFLQQTLDTKTPLQPFKAVIQPQGSETNIQQNVLFQPDPNYVQQIQEQFMKTNSDFQPNFHSFNYEEPNVLEGAETVQSEQNLQPASKGERLSNHHLNFIRNTQEGSASNNQKQYIKNNTESISSGRFAASANNFISSIEPQRDSNSFSESSPLTASYFTQVSDADSGSVSTNYFTSVSNKDLANTILAAQSNDNLLVSQDARDIKENELLQSLGPIFSALQSKAEYSIEPNANSGFTPIKSSPLTVKTDDSKEFDGQSPMKIFISEQYDDIETQPSQNIPISASLNANQNDFSVYNTHDLSDDIRQQDYVDFTDILKSEKNTTNDEQEASSIVSTNSQHYVSNPRDVVVTLQKNETNPSLDILTKDWKTSIVLTPTEKNNVSEENLDSGYGSKTKPKRD